LQHKVGTTTDTPQVIRRSQLVRDAYELLVDKHVGQVQKVNGRPYVEHPAAVATDVSEAGFDPEMVAAALLHDIVEDSHVTVDDVRERFGDRVAGLVEAMTDRAEIEPYERRKALHRERVVAAGPEAAAIFAADKLNNVRALRSAYQEQGEEVAKRFVQPLEAKLRVWVADAEMVSAYAAAVPYAQVLEEEVDGLRADRLSRRPA
jgi:guanosine-3',5'-bis(diphosphate) 3'-pyrophosphohydrolase